MKRERSESYSALFAALGPETRGCKGREDWSKQVAPFWTAVLKTALTPNGMKGLMKTGLKTIRGAAVMPLMRLGFASGTIKFNLITAVKPEK